MNISCGNKKLPKSTAIFNLPAVKTCPGRTSLCSVKCYALKAERLYLNVFPARKANLKASQDTSFVQLMIDKIKQSKRKVFRIHEAGDFYNQDYLNKWFIIAEELPEVKFYAYTKSFHLNFKDKPDNFVLIASFDNTTTGNSIRQYEDNKQYFDNTFTIVDRHAKASCIQDCTKCNACWIGKGLNITVNQH